MENFKIVGYLVTYRLFADGLTHIDRFNTLDSAEDFVDTSDLAEYVINPIVDLSGEQTMKSSDLVLYLGGGVFGVLFAFMLFIGLTL